MSKLVLTHSNTHNFRNCRKKFELRNMRRLVPIEYDDTNLKFGSNIHDCLERYYLERTTDWIQDIEDVKARAMMQAYVERYEHDEIATREVEMNFEVPLLSPVTREPSDEYALCGKVDGIVELDGDLWLIEHKTAARIDGNYIERLKIDAQTALYTYALRRMGYNIVGTIYNVLGKVQLRQSIGETEEEFEARKVELIAKSKTGKTSAKQKIGETDEEFYDRVKQKYDENPALFYRTELFHNLNDEEEIENELWDIAMSIDHCVSRGYWYKNTTHCMAYNRPCEYFQICASKENPLVIEQSYTVMEPNNELKTNEVF